MAGDWTKVENCTPDKPEIMVLASILKLTNDDVFGKCFRMWRWFGDHTIDGHARSVTLLGLDAYIGVTGWCAACQEVGWLDVQTTSLNMPNFERHCSKSAKTRALSTLRKEKSRHAPSVTKARPEKRREEKSIKDNPLPLTGRCVSFTLTESLATLAVESGFSPDAISRAWSEWYDFRIEKKKPLTERMVRMTGQKFKTWGLQAAIASIEASVSNGYQGLFEPKGQTDGRNTNGAGTRLSRVKAPPGKYDMFDSSKRPDGAQVVSRGRAVPVALPLPAANLETGDRRDPPQRTP